MATASVRSAAVLHPPARWIELLGRTGYAAKGAVYLAIGALALRAAWGAGTAPEGGKGALAKVADEPFGTTILWVAGIGLLAYVAFRVVQAIRDPGRVGTDAEGLAKRATYLVSGLLYLSLAVFAFSLAGAGGGEAHAAGAGGSGGSGSTSDWTADLMAQPFGRWLVGIVGLVVVGFGLRQFHRAYTADFLKKYDYEEMDASKRKAARVVGRAGLSARGLVACMIGVFFVQAALQADPQETKGLGGALQTLASQPYGSWLLGLVALGLACYGVYCFSYARYRDFRRA